MAKPARRLDQWDQIGAPITQDARDDIKLSCGFDHRYHQHFGKSLSVTQRRQIAPGITKALAVPGSMSVKRQAEAEGLDKVFEAAGFEWRMSGCSVCFYAGGEGFPEASRVISSTNRNFEGRQGPGIRTHIASPETVAASAIAGVIADPRELGREENAT